jgi:endogenous inhibitor of DNA gyrase (YacG/DUF329 family)
LIDPVHHSCPCEGSNENCALCFGTGVWNPHYMRTGGRLDRQKCPICGQETPFLAQHLMNQHSLTIEMLAERQRMSEPKRSNSRGALVHCPRCHASVNAAFFHSHSQTHRRRPSVRDKSATERGRAASATGAASLNPMPLPPLHIIGGRVQQTALVRCPHCGASVKASRLPIHMARVHQTLLTGDAGNRDSVGREPSGRRVRCPHCRASVKASRLQDHLRRVHPKPSQMTSTNQDRGRHDPAKGRSGDDSEAASLRAADTASSTVS